MTAAPEETFKCCDCLKYKRRDCFDYRRHHGDRLCNICKIIRRQPISEILETKYAKIQCEWCGIKEPDCLDYDHIDPRMKFRDEWGKKLEIVDLPTLLAVEEEIKKCQVLCRICHIFKTLSDAGGPYDRQKEFKGPSHHMWCLKQKIVKISREQRGHCSRCMLKVQEGAERIFFFENKPDSPYTATVAQFSHGPQVVYPYLNLVDAIDHSDLLCANCREISIRKQWRELPRDIRTARPVYPKQGGKPVQFHIANAPAHLIARLPREIVMECEATILKLRAPRAKRKCNQEYADAAQ